MLRGFNYVNDGRKSIILIIILLLIQIARVCVFIKEKIDFEFIKSLWLKAYSIVSKRSGYYGYSRKKLVRCYLSITLLA